MKRYAVYLAHARSEHEYREWIIMPATDRVAVNVWTRYLDKEGSRPVWRGTKHLPTGDADMRALQSNSALTNLKSTLSGHYRQNDRNPGGRQWTWRAPIVVEVSDDETLKFCNKTPYPALNRIKRVLAHRAATSKMPDADATLARIAELLRPVS